MTLPRRRAKLGVRWCLLFGMALGCTHVLDEAQMDTIARRYVQLVLELGQHDGDYVDAYYGPPDWASAAGREGRSLAAIRADALDLLEETGSGPPASDEELVTLRYRYLGAQLRSLVARAGMLSGDVLSFDEESRALYDAAAPRNDATYYQSLVNRLDARLPGAGTIPERYDRYRSRFIIPPDRVDAVMRAAIAACRERTIRHVALPAGEDFVVEYVNGKSWSAYNWYQGDYKSLIQVNLDLPVYVDRAVDLACHEGYPGHHVYNVLLEHHLTRGRGWVEFSVYPLFSPQSLIAEGSANYGIEVAFPGDERAQFEGRVLYPLAGLAGDLAEEYAAVQELVGRLSYAGNEAARGYLDGEMTEDQAVDWLQRFALMSEGSARQRVRFFDQYRAYVINYNLGRDLVRAHVDAALVDPGDLDARWARFAGLLASPRLPSGLER